MGERDGTAGETQVTRAARRRQPRWVTIPVAIGLLFAVAALIATIYRTATTDDPPDVRRRDDPTTDLLGWLPADDATRRSFAVWAGEAATGATPPAVLDVALQETLGITPYPLTLGRSAGWREAFGWGAGDVEAWAVAGEAMGGTAILAGDFDLLLVRERLEAAGYRAIGYRGALLYVLAPVATPGATIDGDATAAANVVGLLAGRLITAASEAAVRAAVDAALGAVPSLADDPAVGVLLTAVGPSAGLVATDAAELAALCAGTIGPDAPSGRYAAIAYGHAPTDGNRQTTVVVTYGDETVAEGAAPAWEYGWADAQIAAGQITAPVAAYGTLTSTGQIGGALIARFADGRAAGWAPLALRLATPVCLAVADLTPAAPAAVATPTTAADRRALALAALPDAGIAGTFVFADVGAIGAARGLTAPVARAGIAPPLAEVTAWQTAIGPLPALSVFPSDPEGIAQFPVVFGIGLDEIDLVAEARSTSPDETIGLVLGRWDGARVEAALLAAGYASITLGEVTIFAIPSGSALPAWAPPAWANIALAGDRLYLSPSSQALRAAATASEPEMGDGDGARADLLAAVPSAAAGFVVGAEAARLECAARGVTGQSPAWSTFAALWSAGDGAERATLALIPAEGVTTAVAGGELSDLLTRLRVVLPAATGETATVGAPFVDAFGAPRVSAVTIATGSAVIVEFAITAEAPVASYFPTIDGGCAVVARP